MSSSGPLRADWSRAAGGAIDYGLIDGLTGGDEARPRRDDPTGDDLAPSPLRDANAAPVPRGDTIAGRDARPRWALCFTIPLFLISLSWMYWYDPRDARTTSGYVSCILELAAVYWAYTLIDARLRGGKLKFLLAGLAALFCAYTLVDAALLRVTMVRLHHSVTVLQTGGDFFIGLSRAGFTPYRLLQIGGALAVGFIAGGVAHRYLWRCPAPAGRWGMAAAWGAAALLPAAFVAEQAHAHYSIAYHSREMVLPAYWQLYSGGPDAFTEIIPGPPTVAQRRAWLDRIGPAKNPRNVVFIILESVRADAVTPQVAPNLSRLAQEGWDFTSAYAAGSFTHLSWNTLLLDRPAYTFWMDVTRPPDELGSMPLEILKRAGYEIDISVSTLLDYKGFARRARGEDKLVTRYFQGEKYPEGSPLDFNQVPRWDAVRTDRLATDEAVKWIGTRDSRRPFFLLMNLDATHFPYQVDEDRIAVRPYLPVGSGTYYGSAADMPLIHNRYLNSFHAVDAHIGRVLAALRDKGIDGDTAVIVTSDHGEDFTPGFLGHGTMRDAVRRVPLVMRLPGMPPGRPDHFMAHQNIYPTLFDYLQIPGRTHEMTLGASVFPPAPAEAAALTMDGTVRVAYVTLPDYIVRFKLKWSLEELTFLPFQVTDRAGNPVPESVDLFKHAVAEARPPLRRLIGARSGGAELPGSDRVPLAGRSGPTSAGGDQGR